MTTLCAQDATTLPAMTAEDRATIEHNREQADIDWRGRFDPDIAQAWYRRAVQRAVARRDTLTTPVEHGGGRYRVRNS